MELLSTKVGQFDDGHKLSSKIEQLVWLYSKKGKIYNKEYLTLRGYLDQNEQIPIKDGGDSERFDTKTSLIKSTTSLTPKNVSWNTQFILIF